MNIYKHELKMNLGSVIAWPVALTGLILLYMSLFSSFSGDAELLNEMMSRFPPELLAAFGMDNFDLTTVLGFFGVAFLLAQICFAIQAPTTGSAWCLSRSASSQQTSCCRNPSGAGRF
jgi:ABC-2 type transport system permease protein